jgi:hypothetical protein
LNAPESRLRRHPFRCNSQRLTWRRYRFEWFKRNLKRASLQRELGCVRFHRIQFRLKGRWFGRE